MRIDRCKILSRDELCRVLSDLNRKARRSPNTRLNLVIFRLAACCGLRVFEIQALNLSDVKVDSGRPTIHVRHGKGDKARRVPLHWDRATLADLVAWKNERKRQGAGPDDPFICSLVKGFVGQRLSVRALQYRWRSAIRIVGAERAEELSIHSGRHSFVSHALAGGRSLAEVRDAAGHSSIATTNIYCHLATDDDEVGGLFDFSST